ncbi:DUF7521 family protein [Natronobacterium gregoryi]|uniref:Uncharacterized protein n=2 Tax=Natronobacterium gregoryi TaxID=44930 RepID=L0ANM0_NATGS|nr:hypothetical protein [Natronobacterium gregoryi]AFZ74655.1 hypothetical protein Natgr_3539 [Natronobacterium gregoryi SP2]ELY72529.1 hypothetical protein C490_03023 [Natronobacterium gregoryi SP2]PLK18169.1 hypothetical protein CYV19_18535 [Natronobacterium gregoryi SP2]SFJ31485.1 hypothetical protein SAMN05443661_12175 [Natronobacterium gregoryi]
MDGVTDAVLMLMQMTVFALALGLTIISFQSYRANPSKRLESAFIGFAFLSMGVALTTIVAQLPEPPLVFYIAETVPFIVGFGMLYLSLYR